MVSFSGEKRSGKTLCMSMIASVERKKRPIMSSIPQLKVPHHRLKMSDFIIYVRDEVKSTDKKEVLKPIINWSFWKKNIRKGIYIDEIHNVVGHLDFQTRESKCMKKWVSQVGKVQMDSGDWESLIKLRRMNNNFFSENVWDVLTKEANFYFNSQRAGFIDKYFRDLSDVHINISKTVQNLSGFKLFLINCDFYFSDAINSATDNFFCGQRPKRAVFVGNSFFGLYGTHTITTDGSEYL